MAQEKHASVASYIIVALILGVITYIEFAIVEYPQAWLGPSWTMFWLILLSIVKFVMVIMFFMHLKDDDATYTGFFSSGMFIAMATFVGLTAMFVLPRAVSSTKPENVAAGHATHEVPAEILDLVESSGLSRSAAAQANNPRPADRSVTIERPLAANDGASYQLQTSAAEPVAQPATDEPAAAGATGEGAPAEAGAAGGTEGATGADGETEAAAGAADGEPAGTETAAGADADEADEAESAEAAAAGSETPPAASAGATWDAEAGASVYAANCVACHQGSGQGIPAAFPPLADHAADVYEAGGREFLMDVVLFGMQGAIQINGMTYNGFMPAWPQLSDDDIASVLNHIVTAWNDPPADFAPYQAGEVTEQRGKGLNAADVHAMRAELGL